MSGVTQHISCSLCDDIHYLSAYLNVHTSNCTRQTDSNGALVTNGYVHTAEEVRAMQGMFNLMDLLVRRRYLLQLSNGGSVEAAMQAGMPHFEILSEWSAAELKKLSERATSEFGISDIDSFHREMDIVCLARSRLNRSQASVTTVDANLLVNARKKVLGKYPLESTAIVGDEATSRTIAVHLLTNNIDIYEKELASKIDYVLTGDTIAEEKIISEYLSVNRWKGVREAALPALMTSIVAIPLVAVFYVAVEYLKK